ncbi:MAG: hypothetical protein QT00_C0002G0347 [archaeon GW2011_AR5]|nr:MAG: hypothetical protein QT00_C0002G0347 [archaeon GW2011_AR5]
MEPLEWIFVTTFLTLVFIVFAVNPLQVAIGEAVQNSAQLQSQRLASVINIVQSSPDGTTYRFNMPNANCRVLITNGLIHMSITPVAGTNISYTMSGIKTPTIINAGTNGEFACRANRLLEIRKRGGAVEISSI